MKQLMNCSNVNVIYLDYIKSFDVVDHRMICRELRRLGIIRKFGEQKISRAYALVQIRGQRELYFPI